MFTLSFEFVEGRPLHSHVRACTLELRGGRPLHPIWDIGGVDEDSDYTADENFQQFWDLVEGKPDAIVVLAHCGVGPPTVEPLWADAWKSRIDSLLARPNIYFDLAGMQIASVAGDILRLMDRDGTGVTEDVGKPILEWIAAYPDRFMLGTDVETRSFDAIMASDAVDLNPHIGVREYGDSITNYLTFLEYGVANSYFGDEVVRMVAELNAREVYNV